MNTLFKLSLRGAGFVIASEARQSMTSDCMDCNAALAMTTRHIKNYQPPYWRWRGTDPPS